MAGDVRCDVILTLGTVGVQPPEGGLKGGQDGLAVQLVQTEAGVDESLGH